MHSAKNGVDKDYKDKLDTLSSTLLVARDGMQDAVIAINEADTALSDINKLVFDPPQQFDLLQRIYDCRKVLSLPEDILCDIEILGINENW